MIKSHPTSQYIIFTFLFCIGCLWLDAQDCNFDDFPILQEDSTQIFEAKITRKETSFGGLLILKIVDEGVYRVALTSKFGMKILDYTLTKDNIEVNYAVTPLDKKIIHRQLHYDLKLLLPQIFLGNKCKVKDDKVIVKDKARKIKYLTDDGEYEDIVKGFGTRKVELLHENNELSELTISHRLINLELQLKPINKP